MLEGETELRFYLGYTTNASFALSECIAEYPHAGKRTQLQEVVIVSDKTETGTIATRWALSKFPMTQIKNTPSILGEADVMKAIS